VVQILLDFDTAIEEHQQSGKMCMLAEYFSFANAFMLSIAA
jgi:hypothetical protein